MFANLIESQSHGQEFKRRGRFVLLTAVTYGCLFIAGGIVSIFAYDARVSAQTSELELINWVPPVTEVAPKPQPHVQPVRRPNQPNAPVDRNARIPERTDAVAPITDPTKVPDYVGTKASPVPPVIGEFRLGTRNVNPPVAPSGDQSTCIACTGPTRVVVNTTPPPVTTPPKPQTQFLPSRVLVSKAISLPQPPYPLMARQIRLQGAVHVQILVDETGRVISAHAVSGHPFLNPSAEEAARRARFSPTLLNDQAVKVQGTIIYNFVLQ